MKDIEEAELMLAIDIAVDIGAMPELLGELIEDELGEQYGTIKEASPWHWQRSDTRDRTSFHHPRHNKNTEASGWCK